MEKQKEAEPGDPCYDIDEDGRGKIVKLNHTDEVIKEIPVAEPKNVVIKEQDGHDMSLDEEDMIYRLHRLLGDRWSLIAQRLPNRTAEDVKKYWEMKNKKIEEHKIFRPKFVRLSPYFRFRESSASRKGEREE